jgi:phosphohistidine phosphatase
VIVTVWRHGEAGRAASDRLRELTGQGIDDIGFGCSRFHDTCHERGLPHPDLICHSPWVRTTQTADIINSAFSHARLQVMEALRPGSDCRAVDAALATLQSAHSTHRHLVLVSHQPLVSRLVEHYLGEAGRVPAHTPGGLATLEMEIPGRGCARLLFWAMPPQYRAGS